MADRVHVVYGSQTGTASDVALWLSNRLRGRIKSVTCMDGNSFALQRPYNRDGTYIFIVATAGNGDAPLNFRKFWDSLFEMSLDQSCMAGLKYAVFGLGDSKYPQFNYAGRILHGRLLNLGAEPIIKLGCGDDQHTLGYSQELIPWVGLLWNSLFDEDFPVGVELPEPLFTVGQSHATVAPIPSAHHAKVVRNVRTTAESHFQEIRRISFTLLQEWSYQPGDVLNVLPRVPKHTAESLITDVLGDDPMRMLAVSGESGVIPNGSYSLLQLFTQVLDITAIPSHYFYEVLSSAFRDQLECQKSPVTEEQDLVREKLDLLASFTPVGANERNRYSTKERIGINEVLWDFRQVRVPLDRLLEIVPRISPRYYSICNNANSVAVPVPNLPSIRVRVTTAEICVGIVDYTTLFGRHRVGLASTYLRSLTDGQLTDRVWLERGFNSSLADDLKKAKCVLMVGPGTGLAPIIPIVQLYKREKQFLVLTSFRNAKTDFLFRDRIIRGFGSPNVCTVVAWSRPDEMSQDLYHCWSVFETDMSPRSKDGLGCEKGRKTWVQDLVPIHADRIRDLVNRDCVIVIAGRSHPMPADVIRALEDVVGKDRIHQLGRARRIIYDT